MKKFITALGFCLIATTANAGEFECTMSKAAYIDTLEPLVPALRQKYKEGNFDAIQYAEDSLEGITMLVYEYCSYITTLEELDAVIEALAIGTIRFDMTSDK
jgi:hypothetical protein